MQEEIPYLSPLDWGGLLAFLGPRTIPGIEAVGAGIYWRTITYGGSTDRISVRQAASASRLLLTIPDTFSPHVGELRKRLRHLFDLDSDPREVGEVLGLDPLLQPLVQRRPGLRVPGCWCPFELIVRAILGQQVTVRGATTLATRLVRRHGRCLEEGRAGAAEDAARSSLWAFPTPAALATADLSRLGMPGSRGRAINKVALAVARGTLDLQVDVPPAKRVTELVALPGIGPWTAQYVAMRAFHDADAFPASDLEVLKALGCNGTRPTARQAQARAAAWQPWRAYATMHLWLRHSSPENSI